MHIRWEKLFTFKLPDIVKHKKNIRALSAVTDPNGPEQLHLDLHPHLCPWAWGFYFSLVLFPSIQLSHTASRPLPSLSPDIPAFLTGLSRLTSGLLCHLTFVCWSLGCWQDMLLSPALLCSPCLGPLCLAGGDTALPCAGLTLSALLEQGRCCSLTVNCCTHPGTVQELERFGFNHY